MTRRRAVAAAVIMLLAGLQLGLWLADWYDDRVHSPLSLAIGIAFVAIGAGVLLRPFVRR